LFIVAVALIIIVAITLGVGVVVVFGCDAELYDYDGTRLHCTRYKGHEGIHRTVPED